MEFAVIKTGGKQYRVSAGEKFKVEKLVGEVGATVTFSEVLLHSKDGKAKIGLPHVEGATVEATILNHDRDEKKLIFRYHSKVRYRKRRGHRQHLTEVQITKV